MAKHIHRVPIEKNIQNVSELDIISISNSNELKHIHTLKIKINATINIFNQYIGEWKAVVKSITKSEVTLQVVSKIADFIEPEYNYTLAFSPIKPQLSAFIIEKAVELGCSNIMQVITENTNYPALNEHKVCSKIISATKQCRRLDTLNYIQPLTLEELLKQNKKILWLNEQRSGNNLSNYLIQYKPKDFIFFIGPEGGFSNSEREALSIHNNVISVYLPTNILKTETIVISAISQIYAIM